MNAEPRTRHGPATTDKAIALEARPADAWYGLGDQALQRGDLDEAQAAYERALEAEPAYANALYRLGEIAERRTAHDRAAELYRRALVIHPGHVSAQRRLLELRTSLAELIDRGMGRVTPGELQFEGRPLLRACAGRFASASAVIVTAIVLAGITGEADDSTAGVLAVVGLVAMAGAVMLIVHALLWAVTTRYRIYERRIDITTGITSRITASVWLYEITDLSYVQPLSLLVVNTAGIALTTERGQGYDITAPATARRTRQLWEQLRNAGAEERPK